MENKVIIDPKTFSELKDLMGADFVVEIIDTFIQETGDLIKQLHQALGAEDGVTFGRCAHAIKSSSASLGALDFSELARELEMLGKANDFSGADPLFAQLSQDFMDVKNSLEELKHEP